MFLLQAESVIGLHEKVMSTGPLSLVPRKSRRRREKYRVVRKSPQCGSIAYTEGLFRLRRKEDFMKKLFAGLGHRIGLKGRAVDGTAGNQGVGVALGHFAGFRDFNHTCATLTPRIYKVVTAP